MKRLFIFGLPLLAAGIIHAPAQVPAENPAPPHFGDKLAALNGPEKRPEQGEPNLLTNGNFEKGTAGWEFFNWGKRSKMGMDGRELHDGKPSLRVENFDLCHSYVRQIIHAKPNTRYRLTGYIKTGHIQAAKPGRASTAFTRRASTSANDT